MTIKVQKCAHDFTPNVEYFYNKDKYTEVDGRHTHMEIHKKVNKKSHRVDVNKFSTRTQHQHNKIVKFRTKRQQNKIHQNIFFVIFDKKKSSQLCEHFPGRSCRRRLLTQKRVPLYVCGMAKSTGRLLKI